MFKRVLIPTDGSPASQPAILAGAEIIGPTVTQPFHTLNADPEMIESTPAQYEQLARQQAGRIPETIISTARDAGCDLILMASHGRKGIKGLLLGSETQKVLVHSAIPVLVYR